MPCCKPICDGEGIRTPHAPGGLLRPSCNSLGHPRRFQALERVGLGTLDFNTALAEEPLLINDLRTAACEQALRHGLLETHRQVVGLALPGLSRTSPIA